MTGYIYLDDIFLEKPSGCYHIAYCIGLLYLILPARAPMTLTLLTPVYNKLLNKLGLSCAKLSPRWDNPGEPGNQVPRKS